MGKILVTGAGGFIGTHLVQALSEKHSVVAFDLAPQSGGMSAVEYIAGDITCAADIKAACSRVEGIIHLGAVSRVRDGVDNPFKCMQINVMGTMTILETARGAVPQPWIILGSTVEPSGNIYGLSKHIAEQCAERYAYDHDLRTLALRFATTYGSLKDNKDKVIPKFIRQALAGEDIVLANAQKQFDFIYVEDIISGILAGVSYIQSRPTRFFDAVALCTGNAVALKQLAEIIVQETGSQSRIIIQAEAEDRAPQPPADKAKALFGFEARTAISDGIKKTVKTMSRQP